jgi:hypothetical protein
MTATVAATPHARRGPAGALGSVLVALLAGLAAGACGPSDPLEGRVDAGDPLAFSIWRSEAAGRLTPAQLADLDKAVQEYRFHVMARGGASGSAAVEDAALRMIGGRSVRHVLRQGLGWALERASDEKAALEASMRQNALMRTRPGDTASEAYLADLADRQASRLRSAAAEVDHVRERLAAAGGPLAPADAEPAEPAPKAEAPKDALPPDAPPVRIP